MGVGKEAPGMLLHFGAEALEQLQGRQLFMKAAANFRGKVTTVEKKENTMFSNQPAEYCRLSFNCNKLPSFEIIK